MKKLFSFETLLTVAALLIAVALVLVVCVAIPMGSCALKGDDMGRATRWTLWSGCLVAEKDGTWIPFGKLRSGQ